MNIFPAIDLRNQKCVRLTKGKFSSEKVYNEDPIHQAEIFYKNGLKFLHIVDLDGALAGELKNLNIIKNIIKKFKLKVQVGGGIRNEESIKKLVDIGADKIILGTAAIKNDNFLKRSCERYTNSIALALDVRSNKIAISGWTEQTDLDVVDYLEKVKNYGIARVIYTDINKDGTSEGPNFEDTYKLAERFNIPFVISGGISSIDDVNKLIKDKKIEGIIIGKAIYENKIDLSVLGKI
jgi:phosphoribosylformimino-5-aminoimidazole carboxamide ribotide isomerase